MEFRKCSVGGISYGFGTTEIGRAAMERTKNQKKSDTPSFQAPTEDDHSGAQSHHHSIRKADDPVPSYVAEELSSPDMAQAVRDISIGFDDPRLLMHLSGTHSYGATESRELGPPVGSLSRQAWSSQKHEHGFGPEHDDTPGTSADN